MDDDFSLFDPLQPVLDKHDQHDEDNEVKNKSPVKEASDQSVIVEDLLGEFGGVVKVDSTARRRDDHVDNNKAATSFFLLDLDTNTTESTAAGVDTTDAAVNHPSDLKSNFVIDINDDDNSSVNSDVLSVNGDNLPLDTTDLLDDDEPQSGFFFNDLLVNDTPRVTSNQTSSPSSDQDTTPGVPEFRIGSEVSEVKVTEAVVDEEENLQSLLDIDVPDIIDKSSDIPENNDRVELTHQESFVTEVKEFSVVDDDDDDITETEECPADKMDDTDHADDDHGQGLVEQLRPVFDMCGPNTEGLISIDHLKKMCRESGQVKSALQPLYINFIICRMRIL